MSTKETRPKKMSVHERLTRPLGWLNREKPPTEKLERLENPAPNIVIILAGGLDDGLLNSRSEVNVAAALACGSFIGKKNNCPTDFIFSGGLRSRGKSEAMAMAEKTAAQWEPAYTNETSPVNFYIEERSTTTEENLDYILAHLNKISCKESKIVIICDKTHVERTRKLLKKRALLRRVKIQVKSSEGMIERFLPDDKEKKKIVRQYHFSSLYVARFLREKIHQFLDVTGQDDFIMEWVSANRSNGETGLKGLREIVSIKNKMITLLGLKSIFDADLANQIGVGLAQRELARVEFPVLTLSGSNEIEGCDGFSHKSSMHAFLDFCQANNQSAVDIDIMDFLTNKKEKKAILQRLLNFDKLTTRKGSKNKIRARRKAWRDVERTLKRKILTLVKGVSKDKPIVVFNYEIAETLLKYGYKVTIVIANSPSELKQSGHIQFLKRNQQVIERAYYITTSKKTAQWLCKQGILRERVKFVGAFISPKLAINGQKKINKAESRWSEKGVRRKPINIAITTGDTRLNYFEIEKIVGQLANWVRSGLVTINIFFGVNTDLKLRLRRALSKRGLQTSNPKNHKTYVRIIAGTDKYKLGKQYNRMLFNADLVIANPSRIRALEAAVSGCPLFALSPNNPSEKRLLRRLTKTQRAVKILPLGIRNQMINLWNCNGFTDMIDNLRGVGNARSSSLAFTKNENLYET